MKRKKGKPVSARQNHFYFPLHDICGTWESLCGSPGIKIYHDGNRFRLRLIYGRGTAFSFSLFRRGGITFFSFYGMIQIAYDDGRDMLLLTHEGEYKRVCEET